MQKIGLGGKGNNLVFLKNKGFNVPRFEVISSVFTNENECLYSIKNLCDQLNHTREEYIIKTTSLLIKKRIHDAEIFFDTLSISRWLNRTKGRYTFVRSSALMEDLVETSSAGLFDSVISRTNEVSINDKILHVIASYYNHRAIAYRNKNLINHYGPKMGVILQEVINPDSSGIIFGIDPFKKDDSKVIIESNFGLGTSVVGGSVTPDYIMIDKSSGEILIKNTGTKNHSDFLDLKTGNILKVKNKKDALEFSISNKIINKLFKTYMNIENIYDKPQDVEWAIQDDKIYILQSRPVTTV